MIGSFVVGHALATLGVTAATSTPADHRSRSCWRSSIAMLASGSLNVMIERVAYRPLRNAPKLAPLITAIGMSLHPAERRPAVAPDAGRRRPT